jgi:hypothetical protein
MTTYGNARWRRWDLGIVNFINLLRQTPELSTFTVVFPHAASFL